MKIILTYSDLGDEAIEVLVEWIRERMTDRSPENVTPLRFADKMEVEE